MDNAQQIPRVVVDPDPPFQPMGPQKAQFERLGWMMARLRACIQSDTMSDDEFREVLDEMIAVVTRVKELSQREHHDNN